MTSLDDEALLGAGDPRGMLEAFLATGDQLRAGLDAAGATDVPSLPGLRSVTVCAMGGSAAAGDAVAAAAADRASVPLLSLRGYRVPRGLGPEDLLVCVSYSGNTEETVAAFDAGRDRGCPQVAVCGGGLLEERASDVGVPVVRIPAAAPVPRAGLGALVGGVLGALGRPGILPGVEEDADRAATALGRAARDLGPAVPAGRNPAKELARWVGERFPVVWGSEGVSAAAAWRWKTAFNENAEIPAFASVLPELDHHEVVGWAAGRGRGFCLIVLREEGEHPSVGPRLQATLTEMEGSDLEWREVWATGDDPLSRGLTLALLGDLASAYHAIARGVDPAAMDPLIRVKRRLTEVER